MSDAVWVAVLANAAGIITAILSVANRSKLSRVEERVDDNGQRLDGRLSKMMELVEKVAYQKGKDEGERNR